MDIDIVASAEATQDPLQKAILMGLAADQLIDSPIFKDRVAALKQRYTEQFLNSKPEEKDAREDAYRMIRALSDLCGEFISTSQRGQLAKRELKRKQ